VSGSLGRRDEYTGRSLPLRISHALPLRLPSASGGQVTGGKAATRAAHNSNNSDHHSLLAGSGATQ
jgi:hypothetical protein